jgi:hypothetical protein
LIALGRWNLAQALVVVAAVTLTLLQASSFSGWTGGNAIGPRYLAPAIPLLGVAVAHGIKRFPKAGTALTVISVLLMAMVAAIAIDPPQEVAQPLREFYLVRIRQDRFATNLGTLLGLSPMVSLLALAGLMLPIGWLLAREARAQIADTEP